MIRETLPGHIKHPFQCTANGTAWHDTNYAFVGYLRLLRVERGTRLMQLLRIEP